MTKTGHVIGKVLITSEDVPIPVFQNTVMQKYTIQNRQISPVLQYL